MGTARVALLLCAIALALTAPAAAAPPPLVGRVLAIHVSEGDTLLTVALGTDAGLDRTWQPTLLSNDRPLSHDLMVIRVDKRTAILKLRATFDQIPQNLRVRFTPPAHPLPPPSPPPSSPHGPPGTPIDI